MTFPGGAPGGYPGQGPQQQPPFPGPGYGPPPGGGTKLSLPAILHLAVGGLGLITFFMGFAAQTERDSGFFANGSALPALFLLAAVFSLPAILPGEDKKAGVAPAGLAIAGWLSVLFFTFSTSADVGTGTILLMIFGFLQTGAAVVAFLFDAGILKVPAPNPYGHQPQQPGGAFPPSGQFPAPPPQQPQPPQPGQFGAPPGQQTTFAPQQGQFGQPPQQPGTPPGGYPQQH
ncbi:DUF5336 domain-containing protein [Actinophytocola sp.]|uniref:DUF5336 domain-containing protein n=1 Tax=Actinophytocola sp. TaxID=1872138 RepID=UPI002ED1C466